MRHALFFIPASLIALTACGGGGSVNPSPASSAPSVPAGVAFTSSSGAALTTLTFTGAGSSNAQTFVATQLDGATPLNESDTCGASAKSIATVKAQSNSGGTATYVVTPQNAGACTITVTGANGYSATLNVGITITSVPIQ
jgi:hypothetical protein